METLNEIKEIARRNAVMIEPFDKDVLDRVEYEIDRIGKLGMVKEFCVAYDIAAILDSKEGESYFLGCGSCSLIAYLLDITNINPLEYDLIFERYFSIGRRNVRVFGWFLKEDVLDELVSCLKQKYSRVEVERNGNDIVLHVDEVEVQVVTSIDDVVGVRDRVAYKANATLDTPFTEDYMHLLHYVFGCDYEETDRIRRILCSHNQSKIEEIEKRLVSQCSEKVPVRERFAIFNRIARHIGSSISRAYVVCAAKILEENEIDGK